MGARAAALMVVLLVEGCGLSTPPAATPPAATTNQTTPTGAARQVEVRLTCATGDDEAPCAFQPVDVTIAVGGTVRWVNEDSTYHTVTSTAHQEVRRPSGRFDGVLDTAGEAFTVTFTDPGTYFYYCQPHAEFMAGVVRVVPG